MTRSIDALTSSPEYKELIRQRKKLIWPLLLLTVGSYLLFIFIIAFSPETFGAPLQEGGVISLGIALGLALIFLIFLITVIYVRAANRTIEPLIAKVHAAMGEK